MKMIEQNSMSDVQLTSASQLVQVSVQVSRTCATGIRRTACHTVACTIFNHGLLRHLTESFYCFENFDDCVLNSN